MILTRTIRATGGSYCYKEALVFSEVQQDNCYSSFQDCQRHLHLRTKKRPMANISSRVYWVVYGTGWNGFWRLPENRFLPILLLQFQFLCYNSNRLHCSSYLGTAITFHPVLLQKVRYPTQHFIFLFDFPL